MTLSLPHWASLRSAWLEPRLPLWDPLRGLGQPQLADPQSMSLYPPAWILASLPDFPSFLRAWTIGHSLLAGLFFALLARRSSRDPAAVATAAALGACNGFLSSRITFPNHFAAACWLPVALYCLETGSALGLGLALALQWTAGFPPFSLLTGAALLAAAARGGGRLRTLVAGGLLALGLAAAQWLPFLELLAESGRGLVLEPVAATQYSVPPRQLLKQLLVPAWAHLAPSLAGDPAIVGFYVGPAALLLAAWAAWRGRRVLALAAAAALLLSLGAWLPGYAALAPLRVSRYPANWLLLASGALALLAAAGVAALPGRWRWAAAGAVAADLALFAQAPRHAWADPRFFSEPPRLAEIMRRQPAGARLHHDDALLRSWERQSLESAADYEAMRELLAPSFGAAHHVADTAGYQVLRTPASREFRRRAAVEGPGSPALRWAGVTRALRLRAGAARVEPGAVAVEPVSGAHGRLFAPEGGRLRVTAWAPGRVEAVARLERKGRVVLAEAAYPGWRASVDGRPAPTSTFEGLFPAVEAPAGEHVVAFEFFSRAFALGAVLSAASLAALAAAAWRRKRAPKSA